MQQQEANCPDYKQVGELQRKCGLVGWARPPAALPPPRPAPALLSHTQDAHEGGDCCRTQTEALTQKPR